MKASLADMMRDAGFWRSIAPMLADPEELGAPLRIDEKDAARIRSELRTEGYFRLDHVCEPAERAPLEAAIEALARIGLPALFVFAYERPWRAFAHLRDVLTAILGPDYRPLAAFWAWRIDPKTEESGWPKHRDRSTPTLDENGDPNIVTLWIPITDATTDNGCIRIVPATRDPDYRGDLDRREAREEDVRALPVPPTSLLGWTHQLLHWGGRANATAAKPRMSLSAEFQRRSGPALDDELPRAVPELDERLALIGRQLLRYRHMASPSAALVEVAEALRGV